MTILYVALTTLLFCVWWIVTKKQVKDLMSWRLICFFGVYWFLSLILASVQVAGIKEVSFITMLLMYVNVFSFTFGFSLFHSRPVMPFNTKSLAHRIERIVNNKFYLIILAISSFYVYTLLIQFFDKIILYETLYDVRKEYYEQELYGPLFSQINAFVLKPLALFTMPLFGYMLFKKRNLVCLFMAFFLFGYESLGGGRMGYVWILIEVLCVAYCCMGFVERIRKKHVIALSVIGVVFFVLISFVSAARYGYVGASKETFSEGANTTAKQIVSYTGAPIAAFDVAREKHFESYIGGTAYGNLTLTSVISAFNLVGARIGVKLPVKLPDLIEIKQDQNVEIGHDVEWNALYTAVLYFYYDFGFLGVLIIPFILGVIYRKFVINLYKFQTVPFLVIVSFVFYLSLYSVLDFGFTTPYDFIFLVVLLVVGRIKTNAYGK